MTAEFKADFTPEAALLEDISRLTPRSPFNTPAYFEALHARGGEPCALSLRDGERVIDGCLGIVSGRRLNRRIAIFSVPALAAPVPFWDGVRTFCRGQGVTEVDLQTFASIDPTMPGFATPIHTAARSEFVIELADREFPDSFSSNHRQSVRKAIRSGVEILQSRDVEAYAKHVEMMAASMSRRSARGEAVSAPKIRDFDRALLETGAGEIFQARLDGRVVASAMVLRAPESGYYYLAGVLPEGMKSGASPLLICSIAQALSREGCAMFNLGGAGVEAEGLRQFKRRFGAEELKLEAATYSTVSGLRRRAVGFVQRLLNPRGR